MNDFDSTEDPSFDEGTFPPESEASWQWSRLRPWLLLLAERTLPAFMHHRVDPSDIVQLAMTEAWQSQSTFLGTTTAERMAWLRVILKRSILRQQERLLGTQKRDLRREVALDAVINETSLRLERLAVEPSLAPDVAMEQGERAARAAAVLRKLSADHREVLLLRHFENLSHEAIARRMGRSTAAVRMLWVRALKSLREKLAADDST